MPVVARHFRLPLAALVSATVTFGLFLLMYGLISAGYERRSGWEAISRIHFGTVELSDDVAERSRRKPPPPPPPSDPPPLPKLQPSRIPQPVQDLTLPEVPDLEVPLVLGDGLFPGNFQPSPRQAEGDVVPVVIIRPLYPREAALAGIEGWVRLEFTITATGAVRDPRVVDAQPPRIFNREAIRALLKWKFKPRVVDGVAVQRRATQVIDFSLDDPE